MEMSNRAGPGSMSSEYAVSLFKPLEDGGLALSNLDKVPRHEKHADFL